MSAAKIILWKTARSLLSEKMQVVLSGGSAEGFVYGNNTVTDNSLHDYGEIQKTYISGVNLSGIGNTVSHNEIYNAPHMGVLLYRQ